MNRSWPALGLSAEMSWFLAKMTGSVQNLCQLNSRKLFHKIITERKMICLKLKVRFARISWSYKPYRRCGQMEGLILLIQPQHTRKQTTPDTGSSCLYVPYLFSVFSDVMMGWIRVLSELLFLCFTKHWRRLMLLRAAVTVKPDIFPPRKNMNFKSSEMCKWNETDDFTVLWKVIPCTLVIGTNVSDETSGARMLMVYLFTKFCGITSKNATILMATAWAPYVLHDIWTNFICPDISWSARSSVSFQWDEGIRSISLTPLSTIAVTVSIWLLCVIR
jgi:hypothetical protein